MSTIFSQTMEDLRRETISPGDEAMRADIARYHALAQAPGFMSPAHRDAMEDLLTEIAAMDAVSTEGLRAKGGLALEALRVQGEALPADGRALVRRVLEAHFAILAGAPELAKVRVAKIQSAARDCVKGEEVWRRVIETALLDFRRSMYLLPVTSGGKVVL